MPGTKEKKLTTEKEKKNDKLIQLQDSHEIEQDKSADTSLHLNNSYVSKAPHDMKENRLEIERGENDEYVTPGSATRIGSRPPPLKHSAKGTASASSSRNFRDTWSSIAPSLKVLSPDEIQEQEMQDLEIEDFGSASGSDLTDDDTDDDNDDVDEEEIAQYLDTLQLPGAGQAGLSRNASSLFKVVEPGKLDTESTAVSREADWEQESLVNTARQLSLLENEPDSELDSDEENEIMKEIKAEITKQVKAEMKDELAVMKRQIQTDSGANKPVGDDDLEHLEPDLKAAILKVRKLDRILAKKIKREREVKRERILLQRRLKQELEEIKPEGREEVKEVQVNTSKFLALTLPPRHNAGIRVTEEGVVEEDPSPPVTPVFTTQVPEDPDTRSRKSRSHTAADGEEVSRSSSQATNITDSTSQASGTSKHTKGGSKGKKKKKRKDFIKRNMELAGDAANAIAMTEEEKERVGGLLADLDDIPECLVDDEAPTSGDTNNPYQITLSTGEGFHPALDERRRLEAIDRRLERLLPKCDYDSIASTPVSRGESQQSLLFTRTRAYANLDLDRLGERALRETKEERDLHQRLKDIEYELNHISERHEPEPEPPTLSQETLDHLLDDCVRSMSMTSVHNPDTPDPDPSTSRSALSVASRASLLSNAPRLEPDVLQELLADARRSICGSAAENQLENGHVDESASQTPTNPPSIDNHSFRADSQTPQSKPVIRNQPVMSDPLTLHNGVSNGNANQRQDTVLTSNSRPTTAESRSSSRPSSSSSVIERKPFLPEIDPKGRMSTQRQGSAVELSESFMKSGKPLLAKTVWSSFSDLDAGSDVAASQDSEFRSNHTAPIPHPPTSGRRSGSKNKHRTASPTVKIPSD